jgi:uncharacterized protein YcbK (DUF882 family)
VKRALSWAGWAIVAASCMSSAAARADPASSAAKKQVAKSSQHRAPLQPGTRPARLVNLYNAWTKEWLAVDPAAPPPATTVDRFLRCHFTNQPTAMQPALIATVTAAATQLHGDVVHVVSGFRHPKYNLVLLHAWAKAQKLGGVGLYPESGFIHMDIGPVRAWSGE